MDPVQTYFEAEQAESVLFIAAGVLALAAAALAVWRGRRPFHRGLAAALAAIAAIQLVVGATVFLRTPEDVARVQRWRAEGSPRLRGEEVPRMQAVMRNFAVYRAIEAALLALGAVLLWRARPASGWRGAGLGLALQSALMLALDAAAEHRGAAYLAALGTIAG